MEELKDTIICTVLPIIGVAFTVAVLVFGTIATFA